MKFRLLIKTVLLVTLVVMAGAFVDQNGFLAESGWVQSQIEDFAGVEARDEEVPADTMRVDPYVQKVNEWHENRIERLKEEQGWLRLSGMYWLREGEQMFGSGSRARIRFPENSIPEYAGIFELKADTVSMRVAGNIEIRDERGRVIREGVIYTPEMRRELRYRGLNWFVVQRDDRYAIRLFDD
ncbi:hypothetical protein QLX67_13825, partial [Balneolaceae bacterium ANBcel3]|nr:hypothetical protein [Balneolaceae bacterium ANBcel3]